MQAKIKPAKVFEVRAVHKQGRRVFFWLQWIFVGIILIGITWFLFWTGRISLSPVKDFFRNKFSIQRPIYEKTELPFEEKIYQVVDGKILSIERLEKSSEGYWLLTSKEGLKVFIDEKKNLEEQVKTLQTILAKARIENKEVSSIDFRFEKVAVRYKS